MSDLEMKKIEIAATMAVEEVLLNSSLADKNLAGESDLCDGGSDFQCGQYD